MSEKQRLEKEARNKKLEKLQKKVTADLKKATADLSKKIEEKLNNGIVKSNSVKKQGDTVLTLTMKDKKTGQISSVKISAKDVQSLAKITADTIMNSSIEMSKSGRDAISMKTLNNLGDKLQNFNRNFNSYSSGPSFIENLKNITCLIKSNRGGDIDITKSVISTAQFLGQGFQEIPGDLKSIAKSAAGNAPYMAEKTAGCFSSFVSKVKGAREKTFNATVTRS
jgi:hypothetical protein